MFQPYTWWCLVEMCVLCVFIVLFGRRDMALWGEIVSDVLELKSCLCGASPSMHAVKVIFICDCWLLINERFNCVRGLKDSNGRRRNCTLGRTLGERIAFYCYTSFVLFIRIQSYRPYTISAPSFLTIPTEMMLLKRKHRTWKYDNFVMPRVNRKNVIFSGTIFPSLQNSP